MDTYGHLAAHLALNLVAVCVLTFAVYVPRHRRRDLVPAYLALNVALFGIVTALGDAGRGGGLALGFGLFGVLSIIRLRSDAIQHEEVAYYFTTLVLGLLCGMPGLLYGVKVTLCAVILLVVYAADHPRLLARTRRSEVTLDAVYTDPEVLREELGRRLGEPLKWTVLEVDFVRDLTVVDVRYRVPAAAPDGRRRAAPARRGVAPVLPQSAPRPRVPGDSGRWSA
ncbi:DUF4956 domain-containing protein [Streptomyces sp. A7024]|uniref:DUF4956 domain-containing protein n=1 Tax=Streptomyces coryli TaxID=1128680 RepID=A0A6G4U3V3_9ACTN|nr:DUF4956 domain-containing protein [Streptomyces coryli]NGN66048.1 DUF4956 domain-containing protein [Streptomyces coryli]